MPHYDKNITYKYSMNYINKFRLILFIIGFFFLNSCDTTDKETKLKGYVMDFYSDKPVNNYRLKILRQMHFDFDGGYNLVDSIKTDSSGMFSITFLYEYDYNYKLTAGFPNDYSPINEKDIDAGKTNDFLFHVKPYSVLCLEFMNITHIYYSMSIYSDLRETWSFKTYDVTDTIFYFNYATPDENFNLSIYLHKKNSQFSDTTIKKSIWIEHKDTVYYKIEL
jgi:hypothetical protein